MVAQVEHAQRLAAERVNEREASLEDDRTQAAVYVYKQNLI